VITLKNNKLFSAWMIVAAILSFASVPAFATEESEGAYIGGGIGSSNWKSSASTNNYTSSGLRLIGGYQLNPIIAVEAEYFDLGSINVPYPVSGNPNASIKAAGMGLSGVGLVPFYQGKLAFYGKMGVASISTTVTAPAGYVFTVPSSSTNTSMSLGIGLNFNFTRNAIMRLSLDRYECSVSPITNNIRVDMYGLAGIYHF
jgi:opacity protein-like surface antigen